MSEVRRLEAKELEPAVPLLAAEGWSFEVEELERLRALGGAVGAFEGGKLVGFLSFLDVAPVRWVGNVVVAPDARGRGVAAEMVRHTMEGATTTGLFSVEKAVTLYERLGFQPAGDVWIMRAEASAPKRRATAARPLATSSDSQGVLKLDKDATGMERAKLLIALSEAYAGKVRVVHERNKVVAFGIAKTYADVTEIGPLVAASPAGRDHVLDTLLALAPAPYEAAVPAGNAGALAAFEERGFQRRARTVLMWHGTPPKGRASLVAAAAGLEKG